VEQIVREFRLALRCLWMAPVFTLFAVFPAARASRVDPNVALRDL
jgi:hypothetical protein